MPACGLVQLTPRRRGGAPISIGFDSGAIIFVRSFDATWLGYIMAHELGHILLGPNAHALVGIMRGTLLRDDWEKAAQGTLSFTRSQAKQIRRWIIRRKPLAISHSFYWPASLSARSAVRTRMRVARTCAFSASAYSSSLRMTAA
jgi:hypothetical protein